MSSAGKTSEIKVAPNGELITAEKEQGEKEDKDEGKKAPKKTKKPWFAAALRCWIRAQSRI